MNATIRAAAPQDIPAILEIVNDAIANTSSIYDYNARTLEMQHQWFKDKIVKNFPVIVAENNAEIIGYGTFGTFREKAAYHLTVEHSVYVKTGFAGRGIGSMLLTELIVIAKAQKLHVMIGAIDAANTESIDFHKKFGFTECGVIREVGFKFDRWLDLMLMQLILK
jgi:phosphinothricin acetyltransferase